ncbi:MerR family DNA-binding protein [Aureimonas sp. SK2]|uniref:MerR family DNA-binding protein n=1 Tax=Aureimonas sp. SK2 TaxID=3015992 RepID=UPI00326010CA
MPLTIGRLAEQAETKVETVRYYQRAGLLPIPEREDGGFRTYGSEHVRRLRFIRRARALGLPLASISTLLDLSERRDDPCAAIDRIVRRHRNDVEARIADLVKLRQELDNLLERCDCTRVAECRIVETLTPDPLPSAEEEKDRMSALGHRPGCGTIRR